jgi:hypothetical protein
LETITEVKPGASYGHIVKIGRFEAVWALPLRIQCSLRDMQQLSFRKAAEDQLSWEWELTLHPNRLGGQREELLICGGEKIRKKDEISVRVTGDTIEENLPLEVKIE